MPEENEMFFDYGKFFRDIGLSKTKAIEPEPPPVPIEQPLPAPIEQPTQLPTRMMPSHAPTGRYQATPSTIKRMAGMVSYEDLRPDRASDFSGNYNAELLQDIIEISKESGVDPYIMIAIGLQETTLGTRAGDLEMGTVFNVESEAYTGKRQKQHKEFLRLAYNSDLMRYDPQSAMRRSNIRRAAELLKAKRGEADSFYQKKFGRDATFAEYLQAWQGYGRIPLERSFGGQRNLVGWRDIPHGKQVIQHIQSLQRNPSINDLIQRITLARR